MLPSSRHVETQETCGELSPTRLKELAGKIHVTESLLEFSVYLSLGNPRMSENPGSLLGDFCASAT